MKQSIIEAAHEYATEKTKFRKDVLKECGYSYCKEQSPWISVKDKLPEPEQEVFLYDRDSVKHYAIGWLRKKKGYCKSKWFVTNGYVTDESITHWMPIPKFNV